MSEEKEHNRNLPKRGYWYERLPTGESVLCFKVKVHGTRFTQKLVMPKEVRELKPLTV